MTLERANLLKRIADKYDIPLICTAEVRKSTQKYNGSRQLGLDDIMETAKFAYNANLVWLLSEEESEKWGNKYLRLSYAKNKITGYKQTQSMDYHAAYGKVTEHRSFEAVFR